ncbi:MAG: transposase, partial [Pseudomonadota bacterium]
PLLRMIPDWAGFLAAPTNQTQSEAIERHIRSGKPLGSQEFIRKLEIQFGRPLSPRKRGRKPKT